MKLFAPVALATLFAAIATAQNPTTFSDPANLRGERVKPKTGRELPVDQGTLGLQQMLRKLNSRASLMLIVAHPDDEDGGMLTFYSRGMGARVATLTLTRGEGGQNAMTGDFEDALGLIRTQELLSADRYFGADQMFGTEVDFGFSKTKEEAFSKWTHQRVLYDAVRAVRLYRPLVIAAVFVGGVTDGHGQHQVSGEIAQEVFNAAADPRVFPELTREGILPWAPLKVYARVPSFAITEKGLFDYATNQYAPARFTNYVTGETTTTPPKPDVVVHEGETGPLLTNAAANASDLANPHADPTARLSYVQFARIGLGLQRTQIGPGVRNAASGAFDVSYHRYGSRLKNQPEHEQSFFDGIDTSIEGMASLAPDAPAPVRDQLHVIAASLTEAQKAFDPVHPEACAKSLAEALRNLDRLIDELGTTHIPAAQSESMLHELRIKRVQLNDALVLALGLSVSTRLDTGKPNQCTTAILPSCTARVQTIVQNGPAAPVQVVSDFTSYTASSQHPRTWGNKTLAPGEVLWPERSFFEQGWLPNSPAVSRDEKGQNSSDLFRAEGRPFFSRPSIEQPFYDLTVPELRLAPATPSQAFWTRFSYAGTELIAGHIITTSTHAQDPGVPLVLAPSLSIAITPPAIVSPRGDRGFTTNVEVRGVRTVGEIKLDHPPGWSTHPVTAELPASSATETATVAFSVRPNALNAPSYTLSAFAETRAGRVREGYRDVGYPGLIPTPMYKPAQARIVPVDLNLPTHRRIAYLPGTGDAVPQALASIGLPVTMLTIADLTPSSLARFDTVVLGVRTYNAHPDLHGAPTQALLDFARNGGNVIVQYQTAEFTAADAPYALTLGNAEKVVDETTPVRLLNPNAPVLTTPNRITSADFNGWIEERGHGFLHTWDSQYTALTETHDPGQAPQEGGLITTRLGRGHWTYVAFALYRQLPEAVPGSFRLFANLLGLADQATGNQR